ncbi:hypothetical protein CYMTET_40886 [Cymbomonas tetramitiformis]|uniref:Dienelactone hydrolase domain-containing protein n=1 Tax=Cymbomonas tetramitiformis TaxID=36881 RepID=A0AAE0C8I5_9CHLO|nr:hypothetical protein CYMTET_40886 [Cymbomonas tetramitiformis]
MASTACCAAGVPVINEYNELGKFETINDMDCYFVGTGDKAVVVAYDIFGFNFKQVLQVCDRLAAAGFTVCCPDFFRGAPWPMEKFPPGPEDNLMEWIMSAGSFDKVNADICKVMDLLKSRGATKFGALGFCWGGFITIQLAASERFSAAGCVHAAFFSQDKELAENVMCPLIVLPAEGDPMESVKEVLDTKPFASKCVYKRFDDQIHGFVAARGDWTKPEVAAAAGEAIGLLANFFNANMCAAALECFLKRENSLELHDLPGRPVTIRHELYFLVHKKDGAQLRALRKYEWAKQEYLNKTPETRTAIRGMVFAVQTGAGLVL